MTSASAATVTRRQLRLPAATTPSGRVLHMAAELFLPAASREAEPHVTTLFVCLAGGGMTGRYWSLDASDETGTYSAAGFAGARGVVVATLDHLGTGASDAPDDLWSLTPSSLGTATARAVTELINVIRGELPPGQPLRVVAVAHSMGGLIACAAQAQHQPFDALALFGFCGRGLPEVLTPEETAAASNGGLDEAAVVEMARRRFGRPSPPSETSTSGFLVVNPISADVRAELRASATPLLAVAGMASLLRGGAGSALADVDVPVFLGIAEHDITGPAHDVPRDFPSSRDVTLFVLPGAGHNANVAPNRHELWDRLLRWNAALDVSRGAS